MPPSTKPFSASAQPNIKTVDVALRATITTLAALLGVAMASAQSAPGTSPTAAKSGDETVKLSVFQVTTSKDIGYLPF